MNARPWFAVVLGTLIIPAASTVVASGSGVGAAAYLVADTRAGAPAVSDLSTSSVPVDVYGVSGASARGERTSFLNSGKCTAGNCATLRPVVFARIGERRAEHSAFYGDGYDPGSIGPLDLGLMLLFAVGLVAYQLDRKQRVLRQASLFPAPLN